MNTVDLKFDRYGDISFESGDIELLTNQKEITYQNTVDRLTSSFGDYYHNYNFGANLSNQIGKPISSELEEKIKMNAIDALTSDFFIRRRDLSIISMSNRGKVYLRVLIQNITSGQELEESFEVNLAFNTLSGLTYATN